MFQISMIDHWLTANRAEENNAGAASRLKRSRIEAARQRVLDIVRPFTVEMPVIASLSPSRVGSIAKTAPVLVRFEHGMNT